MYCTNCGSKLPDDAQFCPNCGIPLIPQANPEGDLKEVTPAPGSQGNETGAGGTYTLTIVRAQQFFAVNPAVKVTVDGERVFSLENGSTIRLPVTTGEHIIYFSCGPRNKTAKINVSGDVALGMKWNRITGAISIT